MVTFVFGISPISRNLSRSAPSPPTAAMVPVCPIFSSSSVICLLRVSARLGRFRAFSGASSLYRRGQLEFSNLAIGVYSFTQNLSIPKISISRAFDAIDRRS